MGTLGESSPPFADESSGGEDIGLAVSSEGATVKTAKQWEVPFMGARAGAWIRHACWKQRRWGLVQIAGQSRSLEVGVRPAFPPVWGRIWDNKNGPIKEFFNGAIRY